MIYLVDENKKINILESITVRIILNMDLIGYISLLCLIMTRFSNSWIRSVGWTGYLFATILLMYVFGRFGRIWITAGIGFIFILNLLQLLNQLT